MESNDILREIAQQVAVCQKCPLHNSRKKPVPGEGPADAKIMFIGEGPGFHENEQGRPFVGAAGNLLSTLLEKGGFNRENVFITNVVKCRPPGNRDPLPEELEACSEYLDRQIEAINPKVIVTLGRFSMARYLSNVKISNVHGKAKWVDGRLIIPMFHPAAALHQRSLMSAIEQDFSRLPEWIKRVENSRSESNATSQEAAPVDTRETSESNDDEPTQLSLF